MKPITRRNKRLFSTAQALSLLALLFSGLALGDSGHLQGYSHITLDGRDAYIVGMHMDVLKDETATLEIEQITSPAQAEAFTPHRKQFANWGFTNAAYWYRTVIVNHSDKPREMMLELTTSWIDSIRLYTPDRERGEGYTVIQTGDHLPFEQRPVQHHDFLFPIIVEAGESLPLYLQIKSRAAVITPLMLWENDAFNHHDRAIAYYFGAFLGILVIMFIYNLILFFNLRDLNYLYYVLFIASVALVFSTSKGLTYMYLMPDNPLLTEKIQIAGLSFFQLSGILFAKNFFETHRRLPRFNRLFLFLIAGHSLIILLALGLTDIIPLANISLTMVQLNAVILLATGLQAWRQGNRTARYYLVAWSLSVLGVVVTALILLGVLNYSLFLYNATFIGVLLDVAFLSFALSDRINLLRTEKDQARLQVTETLRKAKQELESKVAERTADLIAAKEAADHSSRVKTKFLSNMSHELRTPLNGILGFAQLLETDNRPALSAVQQENVDHIMTSGTHLLSLITDVLDLSRIESGKLSVTLGSVELRSVLDHSLQLVAGLARKQEVVLEDRTPARDFCSVTADTTRLTQVLLNILTNAIKYNYRGGRVVVSATLKQAGVEISINDAGPGIAKEQIDRIFDPFERIDSDRRGIEGTGIGLTISKHLMTLMNGSIGVSSIPGEGTTFTLRLALSHQAVDAIEATPPAEALRPFPTDQHTILYVEDNTLNQKLMRHIFARHKNINLVIADCGLQGVELAKTIKPSMIIMDIRLPDISGFEALAHLRSVKETSTIPMIAVSANATAEDLRKGEMAGFTDYIEKPVDIQRLMATVSRCIQPLTALQANRSNSADRA